MAKACRVLQASQSGCYAARAQPPSTHGVYSQCSLEIRLCRQQPRLWQPPAARSTATAMRGFGMAPATHPDARQRAAAGVEAQVLHTTDSWHILVVSPNALAL